MTFHLEVITPEKVVLSEEVNEVLVPTPQGQIGILPNHVTLLSQLTQGELIIKRDHEVQVLAIESGFLEVSKKKVTILTDYAIHGDDIQVAKVQEAIERAKAVIAQKAGNKDFMTAQLELRRSILELKVAERRKHMKSLPTSR